MLPIHTVTNAHCYLCTVNLYKMLLCKSVLYIMLLIPCGPIRIALLGSGYAGLHSSVREAIQFGLQVVKLARCAIPSTCVNRNKCMPGT